MIMLKYCNIYGIFMLSIEIRQTDTTESLNVDSAVNTKLVLQNS